jgi:acyl-CoA reductase-like NAD-dependent aldehyde dehydrogenase
METRDQLFIGGEWVAPNSRGTLDVISPVSEERIAVVPDPDAIDVDRAVAAAREEIFGPVLVAIPYDDEDHAVAIANDSPFGLGGGIWTGDSERGAAVATRLRTGAITINHAMLLDFKCPFGGFKRSGLGRELGPEGIDSYVELQSIIFSPGG